MSTPDGAPGPQDDTSDIQAEFAELRAADPDDAPAEPVSDGLDLVDEARVVAELLDAGDRRDDRDDRDDRDRP